MTRAEIDRAIALRTDISEPSVSGLDSFDCGALAPKGKQGADELDMLPSNISFEDARGRRYEAAFSRRPDGYRVAHVSYREKRGVGNWETYLAEFEARFGKADSVGKDKAGRDVATWCSETEPCDLGIVGKKPRLYLTFWPDEPDRVERGDHLEIELDEGSDRRDERDRFYANLRDEDPASAQRLYNLCRRSSGKFRTDQEAAGYYLSLMPMGQGAGPVRSKADAVPAAVFAAIGIDRRKLPGPDICFQSMDFFIEDSPCMAYSFVDFRWARRIGDYWLVALKYGGVSLRREFFAVRKERSGKYRKVWRSDTIAGFNAWRENGGIPMSEADVN